MGALVGETVGNYRIVDLIGQGGMGVVYRAEHVLLGKRAAVKVLLPERCSSREVVDRFFNEAKATTLIDHPGIVDIFDFGRLPDGNAYIVMELLDGETLGSRLKRVGRMPADEAVAIACHIAGTLGAAHASGIIHRDLKPDNVYLVRDPALPRGERAKLLDFGIAKLGSDRHASDLVKTETGRLMGTPYYMSPEQCRGAGKVDHRTDIYSLGCVLYQMMTGRPPFVLEGAGEILAAHIHVPPLPLRAHEPSVPWALEVVVLRMLQKDPVRRFQSAQHVTAALNRAALRADDDNGDNALEPSVTDSVKGRVRPMQGSEKDPVFTEAPTINTPAPETPDRNSADVEMGGPVPRVRRLWPWAAMGGVLAAFGGALLTMLLTGGDEDEKAAARTGRAEAGAEARAAEPASPPDVPLPPTTPVQDSVVREIEPARAEETVKLRVLSRPEGAIVYRESDGVRLGRTPLEVQARRGGGEAVFIVRRNGFRTHRLAVAVDHDRESLVVLRPHAPPALPVMRVRAVDEDTLAPPPAPSLAEEPDGTLSDPSAGDKQLEPAGTDEAAGGEPDEEKAEEGTPDEEPVERKTAEKTEDATPDEAKGEDSTPPDEQVAPDEEERRKRGEDGGLDPFNRPPPVPPDGRP